MNDEVFERIGKQAYQETIKEWGGGEEIIDESEMIEEVTPERNPDIYHDREKSRLEQNKKSDLRGCSPMLKSSRKAAISRLRPRYNQFKGAYEHFKEIGERDKANQLREQYQMEDFLPAVEAIVLSNTPDEVLNSDKTLEKLDELSGSGRGFTKAYLKQAYGDMLGQVNGMSDGLVKDTVNHIRVLGAKGMTRAAVAEAKNIKKQIDNGENIASEDDYILISRVANY